MPIFGSRALVWTCFLPALYTRGASVSVNHGLRSCTNIWPPPTSLTCCTPYTCPATMPGLSVSGVTTGGGGGRFSACLRLPPHKCMFHPKNAFSKVPAAEVRGRDAEVAARLRDRHGPVPRRGLRVPRGPRVQACGARPLLGCK